MNIEIKNGAHWFSGIDEVRLDSSKDTNWSDLDGYAILLDGTTYLALEDHCDGYRSYASIRPISDTEKVNVINQFEPQLVYASTSDGEISRLVLKNKFGQIVLEVTNDHSDSYYPYGKVMYYPENLPCNAKEPLN